MKKRCVIQDPEYWNLTLLEGETPLASACTDRLLRLRTEEGFILVLELQEEGFFEVDVLLIKGFHHEALSLNGILNPSSLFFDRMDQKYSWSYRYCYDANLFRPLEKQWKYCHASGPVQIINTCRAFVQELMVKKHNGPDDTFVKNLRWMKEQCLINDAIYWNVELKEGEVPIAVECNDRSLQLRTKEGFLINIDIVNDYFRCFLKGSIELPSGSYLASWLYKHARYEALNVYVPFFKTNVLHWKDNNIYGWDHASHAIDASLSTSSVDSDKRISGPVQVLQEARQVITALMMKESELRMHIMREELMMKTCHPKRVAAWTEQGFDPFY
jgi:hypothetical protein